MFTIFTGKNSNEITANENTLKKLVDAGANPNAINPYSLMNVPAEVSFYQAGQDVETRAAFEKRGVTINVLPESQAPKWVNPES